jgi:alkylhydroperoxidase/carboxymuconolactone decarboxylase family protein YurZ
MGSDELEATGLDPRTQALTRLAAMLALDSPASCYQASVNAAYAAGSTTGEIIGVLIAVGPVIGTSRVVSAAPEPGLALGFDVDSALEQS